MALNDLGKMIKGWLASENYNPTEVHDGQGNAKWVLQVTMPNKWKHFVVLPAGNDETLELHSAFTFSDGERAFLDELPTSRSVELLWELRMGLLFLATEFNLQQTEDGLPARIEFRRQLSYDGLTRNVFMEALREVHKSNLFAAWTLKKEADLRQAA